MIAIVLGGGGSKAAFQVGAVKYLYQEQGVRPNLIAACSGGSLNGAKLAEGGDDAPARLESIWRGLDKNTDMWLTEPWLATSNRVYSRSPWKRRRAPSKPSEAFSLLTRCCSWRA